KTRNDLNKIKAIHTVHVEAANVLRTQFQKDFPQLTISYGDTPSCSMLSDFSAFDEIRPGNFTFYDLSQYHIGSCTLEDIAVAMLCPVVSRHPDRSEVVVYGGGVHFSKDRNIDESGMTYFGRVVNWNGDTWHIPKDYSYVRSLSQEHGVIKASPELMKQTQVGDLLAILPIHSCMTVDLMSHYLTTDGKKIEIWDKI
ncbi:MAG: alanine racemase, partial [Bacteroidota bacterium]